MEQNGAPPHVANMAGNKLDLNWLTGKVVELGRANNVQTPVNSVIYAALKPFANGKVPG